MKGKSPLRLLLPALALVLALTAVPAGAALAESSSVRLVGDRTKLVTDPATTKVLLANGIVPKAVGPASSELLKRHRSGSIRYAFPITGGSVDLSALSGSIDHSGGLRFVNKKNGQSLLLTNFRIELGSAALTAEVNGDPAVRVSILDLDFSRAKIIGQGRHVRVKNVDASLTATAAAALNASLGVGFFSAGIELGTAQVFARVAA